MKSYPLLYLLLLRLSLFGQKQVEYQGILYWQYESVDTLNNTPFKFYYMYASDEEYLGWEKRFPKDGQWINFFKEDSTKVASIFEIKNGLFNGKSTQFFLDGSKNSEYNFYKGEKDGYVKYWNKAGRLTSESQYKYKDYGHFQSSILIGTGKSWDDKGNLLKVENYKEGELNGVQLEFYETGNIKRKEFFLNGKRDSTITVFHSNGQVEFSMDYKNGRFVSHNPHHEYHANGSISGIGNLEESRKIAEWQYFYDNGQKESAGTYGTYVYEHDHGDLYFSVKRGLWRYWHPSGTIKALGTYDGEIIEEIFYGPDAQSALALRKEDWKYYNIKGVEISRDEFEKQYKINDY